MAIHHYSVHSPLQSPDNLFLLANEIPTKKRVLIVPLLEREREREREGGRGGGVKKTFTKVHKSLHSASSPTRKKKGEYPSLFSLVA
jgi:hypothetical protein